jgi:hypothetical protein
MENETSCERKVELTQRQKRRNTEAKETWGMIARTSGKPQLVA